MEIVCNKCGKNHDVGIVNFMEVGRDDSMQICAEIAYIGGTAKKCGCGTMLTFSFDLWEYPTGKVLYKETRKNNCGIITEPDYKQLLEKTQETNHMTAKDKIEKLRKARTEIRDIFESTSSVMESVPYKKIIEDIDDKIIKLEREL